MPIMLLLLALLTFPSQQPAPDARAAAGQTDAQSDRVAHAEALLEQGDYKQAQAELAHLAVAYPKDARLQYDLGFTEEHNGDEPAAILAYTAAIAADATLSEPRVALGLLQARAGHGDEAHTTLEAAAKLSTIAPQLKARALRALARLDETANPQQATDELLQAAQLTGEQPGDAELSASLALGTGNTTEAEAAYRRTLAQTPDNPAVTLGLATLLQRSGKLPEADALLTPAVAAHPDDPQLAAQTAALYAAENKLPEAIALLTRLRGKDSTAAANPALTRLLAHLELVSGNAAAAEPLYQTLVTAEPNDPNLLDDYGSTLVRQNKFAQAEPVLAKAVSLREAFHDDAAWGEAAGHLAFAASRNHHPQVALQALAQRATVLPNSPASLFLEATAYDALQQRKKAEQSYRAFLALASGKLPNEEFEARHRLIALEHEH